jgi:hypothetical protein
MPIRVYPRISNVDTMTAVWNDSRIGDYRFVVNGNPTTLAFDKYYWILRDASSEAYTINIVTTDLPDGYLNTAYNQTVEARGGTQPYHFAVQTGLLPAGLTLDGDTGVISGTPSMLGDYAFTIRCTDSSSPQKTDDQDYSVSILEPTGIVDEDAEKPTEFTLLGNYPNPFNGTTMIRLEAPKAGRIRIDIFNVLGQKMETLFDGTVSAGENEFVWNSGQASSGIYFYRLESGERTATRRMMLIK